MPVAQRGSRGRRRRGCTKQMGWETEEGKSSFSKPGTATHSCACTTVRNGLLAARRSRNGESNVWMVSPQDRRSDTTNDRADCRFLVDHVLTANKHLHPVSRQTKGVSGCFHLQQFRLSGQAEPSTRRSWVQTRTYGSPTLSLAVGVDPVCFFPGCGPRGPLCKTQERGRLRTTHKSRTTESGSMKPGRCLSWDISSRSGRETGPPGAGSGGTAADVGSGR